MDQIEDYRKNCLLSMHYIDTFQGKLFNQCKMMSFERILRSLEDYSEEQLRDMADRLAELQAIVDQLTLIKDLEQPTIELLKSLDTSNYTSRGNITEGN